MDNNVCKTCLHYQQHYVFDKSKISWVYCGHCTYQKVKTKRPDTKACENYILSDSAGKAFVTKEYLSHALLEYMLKLELLPQIHNIEKEKSKEID